MIRYTALLILVLVYSCNFTNDSFYNDSRREDLSRLPLIKPYELINVAKEYRSDRSRCWGLKFKRSYEIEKPLKYDFVNAAWVNIEDSVIYGHGWDQNSFPNYYFIIDTKTDQEKVFAEEKAWRETLTSLKCKPDVLHDIWPLFEDFKEHNKLPWLRPTK